MTLHEPAGVRLDLARRRLLQPHDLDDAVLARALAGLHGNGADYGDLYFEISAQESWRLEDRQVTSAGYSVSQGVGARTVTDDRAALAYSSDLTPAALLATADAARGLGGDAGRSADAVPIELHRRGEGPLLYSAQDILDAGDAVARIALLEDIDRRARAIDPRIIKVIANLSMTETVVMVAATDGTLAADVRPFLQVNLAVVAEAGDKRSRGSAGAGGRFGLDGVDEAAITKLVERATRTALVNLDARPAPAGVMPVVLAPGFPGVLFHEAIGHGLEGDAHHRQTSVFVRHMGERVAPPGITVVDNALLPARAGSLSIDDEGTPGERTVLIEDGRLVGLMQDRTHARLMNQRPTGNARRQSYASLPMPRMTNTYLEAGQEDPADIVRSVKRGIYAAEFGGGTVDITSGRFNFSAVQAYLIEDGRITAPIAGATLIGVGHEALKHIAMVGHDLALDEGEAVCGKNGQSVRVCVGQPTIRIDEMTIGGSA